VLTRGARGLLVALQSGNKEEAMEALGQAQERGLWHLASKEEAWSTLSAFVRQHSQD